MIDPVKRSAIPFPNDSSITDPFEFYNSSSTYFRRNSSFADIHTQSTRTSNLRFIDDSDSVGGLDDHFDFIVMSENFNTNPNLYHINGSCDGIYSQILRDVLTEFSDHLPIAMAIETSESTLVVNAEHPSREIYYLSTQNLSRSLKFVKI